MSEALQCVHAAIEVGESLVHKLHVLSLGLDTQVDCSATRSPHTWLAGAWRIHELCTAPACIGSPLPLLHRALEDDINTPDTVEASMSVPQAVRVATTARAMVHIRRVFVLLSEDRFRGKVAQTGMLTHCLTTTHIGGLLVSGYKAKQVKSSTTHYLHDIVRRGLQ